MLNKTDAFRKTVQYFNFYVLYMKLVLDSSVVSDWGGLPTSLLFPKLYEVMTVY